MVGCEGVTSVTPLLFLIVLYFFILWYERLKMRITFVTSQRGAKSRTRIRLVLKRVQDEAEIIPKEPGQVMLPRDRRRERSGRPFCEE